jgi:hypothetical protein
MLDDVRGIDLAFVNSAEKFGSTFKKKNFELVYHWNINLLPGPIARAV